MAIKIEEGKYYKTSLGVVKGPATIVRPGDVYSEEYKYFLGEKISINLYTEDGFFFKDKVDTPYNLVSECKADGSPIEEVKKVEEQLLINMKDEYTTRDGREAKVILTDNLGVRPVIALITFEGGNKAAVDYTSDGKIFQDGTPTQLDLICKPKPPKVYNLDLWIIAYHNTITNVTTFRLFHTEQAMNTTINGEMNKPNIIVLETFHEQRKYEVEE